MTHNIKQIPEFHFQGHRLTKENSERLIQFILAANKDVLLSETEEIAKTFLAQIFLKRIAGYKLPYTVTTAFFMMSMLTFVDRPGNVMILLWLCHQYFKKTGKVKLGIAEWVDIFPWGTPTKEEREKWWDSQKIKPEERVGLNLVDLPEMWKI